MKTLFLDVNFENVPVPEMGQVYSKMADAGWEWIKNGPDWLAYLSKDFPDGSSISVALDDIAALLGDYYAQHEEGAAPEGLAPEAAQETTS